MSLIGRLAALRFGRGGRHHVYTSAGVIVAAVAVVSVLTWLNDAHKPIVRSIEEAGKNSLPEVLEQVDEQVATILGVDEESVRSAREGLAGLVASRQERIVEIATGRLVSAVKSAPATASSPAPGPGAPASGEPLPAATDVPPSQATSESASPQGTSEPSPVTETPPPATSEPTLPATDTPPPTTEEPSVPPSKEPTPPAEEPSPPAVEESPPAASEPELPTEESSPPAKGEQPAATTTSPIPTEGAGG